MACLSVSSPASITSSMAQSETPLVLFQPDGPGLEPLEGHWQ